jgi:hypothetical protein
MKITVTLYSHGFDTRLGLSARFVYFLHLHGGLGSQRLLESL